MTLDAKWSPQAGISEDDTKQRGRTGTTKMQAENAVTNLQCEAKLKRWQQFDCEDFT